MDGHPVPQGTDRIPPTGRLTVTTPELTGGIDPTSTEAKLVFNRFATPVEFERGLNRRRAVAGQASARAGGRVVGRPPTMTTKKLAVARHMHDCQVHTIQAIAISPGVRK